MREVELEAGDRVIDVGCGSGVLLERVLAEWRGVAAAGVDLTPEMLQLARRERRWEAAPLLTAADVGFLPFPDFHFDAALSTSSLHHWPDADLGLREIARVVRPGGSLILTDWCRDIPVFRPLAFLVRLTDPTVTRVYSADEARTALERSGFTVRRIAVYRMAVYWGMMTLTAVREGIP
jgi:ubiquinone/menaquinone biosynthesis C-methylase UbiE